MPTQSLRVPNPLPEEKAHLLARLVAGLDESALHWLSGYAAGLAVRVDVPSESPQASTPSDQQSERLTILVGSQTGNARHLAETLTQRVDSVGLSVRLVPTDEYSLRELKSERLLYVLISTQGDGDPPDGARDFVESLLGNRAPRLDQLKFGVLGLGDSSYQKFCSVGIAVDARLSELGATRLLARADADIDIDSVAQPWLQQAFAHAREALQSPGVSATVTPLRPPRTTPLWDRNHPFAAPVLANQRITGSGSDRDVRHIELSLLDSGLSYEPGDAIGIWPRNPDALVHEIVARLGLNPDCPAKLAGESRSLRDWLLDKREITRLARPFLAAHAQRARHGELDAIIADSQTLARLLADYQIVDVLHRFPADWTAQDFVDALRPMTPRLYSVASSQKVVDDEAHLTVARVAYSAFDRDHVGSASQFLAMQEADARVPIHVQVNERFRLPRDSSRDVIMIGPGTGVAPYRGFMQERTAVGATGRNWLFFGNPHFRSDFLYQLEWQRALKRGELQRLDLAFSRDQTEKTYVQHRIRSQGRALYEWLEGGAHVYVCGDATQMAKDVHAALRGVVAEHGGKSVEDAEAYLSRLASENRYARDVY
ncbi:MAG: assimilatory sulfite reductase (NADPH) flavoprotein subunit [Rudaea sp.]